MARKEGKTQEYFTLGFHNLMNRFVWKGDSLSNTILEIEIPASDVRVLHYCLFTIAPSNGKLNAIELFLIIGILAAKSTPGKALNSTFFSDSRDFFSSKTRLSQLTEIIGIGVSHPIKSLHEYPILIAIDFSVQSVAADFNEIPNKQGAEIV
ncbi:hypothetical protein Pan241w_52030 [Gimesia alba]|uniref:Uncharacterized protein n=1 Tax=Gimesia alba TaxID=2527973 RepID=A0A517RMH4_9PLAN|nr:hypothetical protein [Gimesia alba]QDT45085.1 hypothetical protein Pan241w_52030 [Gimesia alba]